MTNRFSLILWALCFVTFLISSEGLPLYYWRQKNLTNFGDYLSLKLVERILASKGKAPLLPGSFAWNESDIPFPIRVHQRHPFKREKKFLAIGSILSFACNHDVIWGTGVNGKFLRPEHYQFEQLDVRSVRGPLTRQFLQEHLHIECPEVYGDPALLVPYFFPEFKRQKNPRFDYLIIPHYSEEKFFPKAKYPNVVYPTEPWNEIIEKILDARFVISSSLHGIILAEAFGIPARLLKITPNEPIFKYTDYYWGTQRFSFQFATSIEEALQMGGEPPFQCDLQKLYEAFPFEFWSLTP